MENLVKDILLKKELKNLDNKIVEEEILNYFKQHPTQLKKLELKKFNKRSEEYKIVVKEVRKKLREIYGVFIQNDYFKREKLLSKLTKDNQDEILTKILLLHQSSKERMPFYRDIYEKIFEITGKPKSILDLACGLNPLSYPWLGCKPKYIASDLSEKDMDFVQSFFDKEKIDGKTIAVDLVTEQNKITSKKSNVCFLFKALDSFESRKKHISKKLIEKLNCKWIVISFSKISIGGGKKIDKNKRNWVLNFMKKQEYFYKEFEVLNEHFIVVKKQ